MTTCVHHWLLGQPEGDVTSGVCRDCGARRVRVNQHPHEWLNVEAAAERGGVFVGRRFGRRIADHPAAVNDVIW